LAPSHDFHYHLLAAWGAWLGGRLGSADMLFGLSILWWERIGAVAEFVASLLLLWNGADSERFRRFALWAQATKRWGDTPGTQPEPPAPKGADLTLKVLVSGAGLFSMLLMVMLVWKNSHWLDDYVGESYWKGSFSLLLFFLSWMGVFFSICFSMWRLLGWLAEVPSFPHRLKIPAIGLLIVGFHFALLAL
jgi:hypothetical protein